MPTHTARSRPADRSRAARSARVMVGPPTSAVPQGRVRRTPSRRVSIGRRSRWLAVLVVLLVTLLGVLVSAFATPGPGPAAVAQPAPAQLPIPPNPSCTPGSAEPVCRLPATSPTRSIPATPLPPITTLPGGPAPSCFPGSVLPGCGPLDGTPPSPTAPSCEGPNCIPQPTSLTPGTQPLAPIPGAGAGEAECGFGSLTGCMVNAATALFATVVAIGLNPLLDLLGKTLLTTPEPSAVPNLGAVWTESWHILLAAYVVLVLLAGMILMAYQTLQARYTVKELAPRLVVGFLAGTLSLFLATKGIEIANALSRAVLGEQVDPATMTRGLVAMVQGSLQGGGLFLALLGVALVMMLLVLLVTFIVRVIVTILLIAAAPIALMFHALPHTEGIATTWWKAYGGVLGIQVAQSLTLVAGLKIFFAPGGFTIFGPTPSALTNLLLCIALMFVLIKIPFWFLSPLRSSGRRSWIGSLIRGVIAYKTMGLLGGVLGGGKRGGGAPRAGDRSPAEPTDPPATRSGQYLLPLRVRRVAKPFRTPRRGFDENPRPSLPAHRTPGPGQMSLFTLRRTGDAVTASPNPRAVPLKDLPHALPADQIGLPITVRRDPSRVPRRTVADDLAAGPPAPPPAPQPGLLLPDGQVNRRARPPAKLPGALIAPSTGMLPIHLSPQTPRQPRRTLADDLADPARTTWAPQTGQALISKSGEITKTARAHRRPVRDAYTGNRPLASGQYPLPLGVQRQPTPAETPTPDVPARPKRTGTQLRLPLDPPARPRRPKKK